ncbi:MAG: RNA 2',3'-cyclic phosphodiesterase [Desulfuromonadaceae bacterium]|nr:RNA 2',3'-cyclic phosphodiesterase [Desulfuromonadaceae bacterium]
MRLFIAIEIPDDLNNKIVNLRTDIPGARWVPAEQIHLTLAFLGEVEEDDAELLGRELARIKLPEFTLCFRGAGCFPDRHRPHVLWIGLEPEPLLDKLAVTVRATALACGIRREERAFSPHITLARLKEHVPGEIDAFLDQNSRVKLPPFSVREFTLFQSRLTPQGVVHTALMNFQLKHAAHNT